MEGVAVFTLGLDSFHVVSARDEAGAFRLEGIAPDREQTTRDRVRAAITNAGLTVPRNRKITVTPPLPRGALSPNLAIALATLLPRRAWATSSSRTGHCRSTDRSPGAGSS